MSGSYLAFAVLSMPRGDLVSKQNIKAAGCTHNLIAARWDLLQPNGAGSALDPAAVSDLCADFDQSVKVGLKIVFEIALQYPPSWALSGTDAVAAFVDQAGNVYPQASAASGKRVADWVWTDRGRQYVADLISKIATALGPKRIAWTVGIKCGGGYYGELHYPPVTLTPRSDPGCTVTGGSPVIADSRITAADQGKLVSGAGIPGATYVGTVTDGVSFLLSSSPSAQVDVNATGNFTVSLNIGVHSFWGYGAAAQTGAGLASDQAICPLPGYTLFSGTDAQDSAWLNWYIGGLGNWIKWYIAQMRAAGWTCNFHVCHPGYGVRSNQPRVSSSLSAGYRQAASLGEDTARIMGTYYKDPKVWPYSTWLNTQDGAPGGTADSDVSAWKKVYKEAYLRNKHYLLWGENTGNESPAGLQAIFSGHTYGSALSNASYPGAPAQTYGFQGMFWLNYASLTDGNPAHAQLSDLQAAIQAHNASL
ncbi:MAG: hypothetical protein WBP22_03055 [Candidatus Saccharimonas sp.]